MLPDLSEEYVICIIVFRSLCYQTYQKNIYIIIFIFRSLCYQTYQKEDVLSIMDMEEEINIIQAITGSCSVFMYLSLMVVTFIKFL